MSVPVAWRPSPVRAAASCTCSWTTRPWPDAGQRWRAPGLGSPTSASLVHAYMAGAWRAAALALPPHVPLVASEHNQMSWPAGDHTPRARDAARRVGLASPCGPSARALPARNRPVKVSRGDGSPGRGPVGSASRQYGGVDRIFLVQHPVFPEPALLDVLPAWPLAEAGKAGTASGGRAQGHSAGAAARAAGGRLTRLDGAPRHDAAAPGRTGDLNPAGLGLR